MTDAEPDRICGQRTDSGNYCEEPMGECRYHDPPGAPDVVREHLENALDDLASGRSYSMKITLATEKLHAALDELGDAEGGAA